MTDVLVRRCTIRIVRRGGWAWGPRPRDLVDGAIRALPGLLAEPLAELEVDDDRDREVAATVRISASVDADALRSGDVLRLRRTLDAPLRRALDEAAALATVVSRPLPQASGDAEPGSRRELAEREQERPSLLTVLASWLDRGALELVLELVSDSVLELWHIRAFEQQTPSTSPRTPELRELVSALVEHRRRNGAPLDRQAAVRLRLVVAAEAARRRPADSTAAAALVAAALPLPARPRLEPESQPSSPPAWTSAPDEAAPRRGATLPSPNRSLRVESSERPRGAPDTVVVPALPFLVLGPLSRIGYLAALAAVLEAAGHADRAGAFAAALSYKVLAPPERGWRRSGSESAAAAALSGLDAPSSAAALAALARDAGSFASGLDAVVAEALIAGRERGDPVLVRTTPAGDSALVDPKGFFVLRLGAQHGPLVEAAGRPPVVQSPTAVGLDPERVDDILAALDERRAVPLAADHSLERTLTLAAALALGSIAWELWSDREPTDPLLTLERFGDLEARVQFEPERLRVTLPLGRRRRDLADHALLREVRDAPWLGGRSIEFDGG